MIQLAKDKNIYVLLVGVPKYEVITLTTAQIYYEIAAEMDVPLEDTALESILGDAGLKVDNVHPNAKGYEILSKKIAELISQTYLP